MTIAAMCRRALPSAVAILFVLSLAAGAQAEPITLQEALQRAATGSPVIAAAQASVRAAQARAHQAGTAPNPELGVEIENVAGSGPYSGFDSAETLVSVAQRLELGGKRSARRNAALAEVEVAQAELAVARADLLTEVRSQYAEAVAASELVATAQEAKTQAETLARVAAALVEAGREPPLRALTAQAAADERQAEVTAAQAKAAAARRALLELLGEDDAALEPVAGPPETVSLVPDPTSSVDVQLAQAQKVLAEATVRRERTVAAPDVTVGVGLRRFEETGGQAAVLTFSAPIPIRDRNRGAVEAALADVNAAEARGRLALAQAVRRVRDAQASLAVAAARLEVLQSKSLPQAAKALQLARAGYEAGKFPLTDVLDAQAALSAARNSEIEARLARAQAVAALLRAAAQ